MEYITELVFDDTEPGTELADIISALMFEAGAEGVSESGGRFSVFFTEQGYRQNGEAIQAASCGKHFEVVVHPPRNWNSEWEKNYPMVLVGESTVVYAPFHTPPDNRKYRILIHPGMAFGTGHHSTTSLMLRLMLMHEPAGKSVVDMGCGSGVLAIMASMQGAKNVIAIDNDPNSFENTKLNAAANRCQNIRSFCGDAALLADIACDILLANITRNILLKDFGAYFNALNPGGILMLSGFMEPDLDFIRSKAVEYSMTERHVLTGENWVAASFQKK